MPIGFRISGNRASFRLCPWIEALVVGKFQTQTTTADEANGGLTNTPSGYKALCILNLLLCSIASILCVILILSMTLPLLDRKRRKSYSTYNLYLVFLAIPDMTSNAFIIYLLLAHHQWNSHQGYAISNETTTTTNFEWMFDHPLDHNVHTLVTTANLYTNAFLVHEMLLLLKDSHRRKRHSPPTIAKVAKQAMVSYGLGIFIFLVEYGVSRVLEEGGIGYILYQCVSLIFCAVLPLSIMMILSFRIYKQEYLVSTKAMYQGRLKILILFFVRIILTDLLLWVPASIAYMLYWFSEEISPSKVMAYNVSMVFTATQSIVNFGCSLAKPDARKLIVGLVCCRGKGEDEPLRTSQQSNFIGTTLEQGQGSSSNMKVSFHGDPYLQRCSQCRGSVGSSQMNTKELSALEQQNEKVVDPPHQHLNDTNPV